MHSAIVRLISGKESTFNKNCKITALNLKQYCIVTLDIIQSIRATISVSQRLWRTLTGKQATRSVSKSCHRSVLFLLLSLLLYLLQMLFFCERRSLCNVVCAHECRCRRSASLSGYAYTPYLEEDIVDGMSI